MAKITKKTALIWILIVAAVLSIWRFVWQPMMNKESGTEDATTTLMEDPDATAPTSNAAMEAKPVVKESNAVRTATVKTSYKNPGGEDEVGYELTVDENGIITGAKVDVLAKNPISQKRQEAFAEGLPMVVQGKKLSELTAIDKVGGSSLTTASFNASLAQLKASLN